MIDLAQPWRFGATSFVIPATVEDNVHFLGPLVEDVQLLFFESRPRARLSHDVDIDRLADLAGEHDLSYTVHLPLDLRLGCLDEQRRQADLAEICRLVEELAPLDPLAFDLHLNGESALAPPQWQEQLARSLSQLRANLGPWQRRLAIENIDYELLEIGEIVRQADASFCLDFGHLLRYGHESWREFMGDCCHVHLHAVQGGKDHQALENNDWLTTILTTLRQGNFRQVVTLEVYNEVDLRHSLTTLARLSKP